jgi:tetratricopeptide (TPR) repeat protein
MTNGFYYRGLSYERKREWDKAIADFSTAIWREPHSRLALAERGISCNRKGEPERALRDFEVMMRFNPDDALAHALRADTLEITGQPDAALEEAATAIQLDRKLALAHDVRGRAWLRKKDEEKAVREFEEAERVEPNHVREILASAYAFQRRRDYNPALAEFRETAERFPRSANPQNALAWFLATCPEPRVRNGREAITRATLACELTQWKNPGYLDTLAAAYAESGEFDQAMKFINEAVAKLAENSQDRKEIEEHVACFRQRKPWRAR